MADGHHAELALGDKPWTAPTVLPPDGELRSAKRQLEAALEPVGIIAIGRHIDTLAQLTARRESTSTNWSTIAQAYARLLGHHGAAVWEKAVDRWLVTPDRGRWFPSIEELEAIMGPITATMRKQLTRCNAMLARQSIEPTPRETRTMDDKLRDLAQVKRMNGLRPDQPAAAIVERAAESRADDAKLRPLYVWRFPGGGAVLAAERPEGGLSPIEWEGL